MYYFVTTCLSGRHHNGFLVTGALGHTHVRFHVADIRGTKESSSYH